MDERRACVYTYSFEWYLEHYIIKNQAQLGSQLNGVKTTKQTYFTANYFENTFFNPSGWNGRVYTALISQTHCTSGQVATIASASRIRRTHDMCAPSRGGAAVAKYIVLVTGCMPVGMRFTITLALAQVCLVLADGVGCFPGANCAVRTREARSVMICSCIP